MGHWRQINDNLAAQAAALYKSWFIDFEPFELGVDGLPIEWTIKALSDIANTSSVSANPQKLKTSTVSHYSIPAFDAGGLPVDDNPLSILSNKYAVPVGSILVSKLNPETKRIWRTIKGITNAICSTEFVVIGAKINLQRDFLYLMFNTHQFTDFLVSNTTGSTNSRMRVKPKSTFDYEFPCPPDAELERFCALVAPMLDEIESNMLEIQRLRTLNAFLPSKLMLSSHR